MEFPLHLKGFFGYISRNKLFVLFVLLYFAFITFYLRGISSLDPDFGWRLRVGEMIIKNGIPKTDPFSYTMPSFPFVDHAWLFSAFIGLTYPVFKNSLLSLLLAFMVFIAVFYSSSRIEGDNYQHTDFDFRFEKWLHPMSLSVITFLLLFFAVRAQFASWLLFAVLNYLLFKKDYYSRYKYFFPLFFFIWANLHGGYSLGLFVLTYFIFFRLLINKKGTWRDVAVLIFSILATLITPYKLDGWREVASSIFDSRLRYTITEWLPSVTFFDISMVYYISMSTFLTFRYRHEIPKIQYFLFWGLFIFSLSSRRNMPFFMLYSLPLVIFAFEKLYDEIKNKEIARERFMKAFTALRWFSVAVLLLQLYVTYWSVYVSKNNQSGKSDFYPIEAVNYLRSKEINGEIFSNYGWGGYLIWKLPEKKVFIDGRMPSWKFEPANPQKGEASAYDVYLKIENGDMDFDTIADKYNINYVLWPREKPSFMGDLEKKIKTIMKKDNKPDYSLVKYLTEKGWKLTYSDTVAEIYTRIQQERI